MGKFTVYKKSSAMSMNLQPYDPVENKDGAVWLDMSKAKPKAAGAEYNSYDWDNKVLAKLGLADLQKLVYGGDKVDLFHDSPKGTTTIKMFVGEREGTYGLQINHEPAEGSTSVKNSVTVFLGTEEFSCFVDLLKTAIPQVIGWGVERVR